MAMRTQKWMVLGPAGWFQKAAALDPRVAMLGLALCPALLLCGGPAAPAANR
jgi:hypothetical protein